MLAQTLKMWLFIFFPISFFFTKRTENTKNVIITSKWSAEPFFAGQNSQQFIFIWNVISCHNLKEIFYIYIQTVYIQKIFFVSFGKCHRQKYVNFFFWIRCNFQKNKLLRNFKDKNKPREHDVFKFNKKKIVKDWQLCSVM